MQFNPGISDTLALRFEPNHLYYGDCKDVMSGWHEAVDIIYLDPPFNSNAKYGVIWGKGTRNNKTAEMEAFSDMWYWGAEAEERLARLKHPGHPAQPAIEAAERYPGPSGMLSYLTYMAERLTLMRDVLNPTGSIYLHCDTTASHYLKALMDCIFGPEHFQNEIVWHYRRWTAAAKRFQRMHDTLLYYTKSDQYVFTKPLQGYANEKYIEDTVRGVVDGKMVRLKDEKGNYIKRKTQKGGVLMHDVWEDINFIAPTSKERLGYPTQKPLALLERIIGASSHEGDIVLDPFCGCGTTVEAALKLNRRVVGIDISVFILDVINTVRLAGNFPPLKTKGIPMDFDAAEHLAKTKPFEFQKWAVWQTGMIPNTRQSNDGGLDGKGLLLNEPNEAYTQIVLSQVKGHRKGASHTESVDAFCHVLNKHTAAMGVFITLHPIGKRSRVHVEAERMGKISIGNTAYPRLQFWSIQDHYATGVRPQLPPLADPYREKRAQTLLNF